MESRNRRRREHRPKPGEEYQTIVAAIHRQFAGDASVTEDEHIVGLESKQPRQIDVAIRKNVVGYEVLLVVDCKDYKRRVDVGRVDALIGVVDDVRAARGILVSDSGFTRGAIERAKGSGKIDLVSVIDTEDGRLRCRISLPLQVCFHAVVYPFRINLSVPPQRGKDETLEIARLHLRALIKQFFEWCAINAISLASGQHAWSVSLSETSGGIVAARFTFKKTIRCFINRNLFVEARGIYDHLSRKLIEGQESIKFVIDSEQVMRSWEEVGEGYVLQNCAKCYARCDTYNLDSLLDVVHMAMNTLTLDRSPFYVSE